VPKGIVEPGLTPQASAAKEAFEEAGIAGEMAQDPLGSYERGKWGGTCEVTVYPMHVSKELPVWAEAGLRTRNWMTVEDALRSVNEPGLRNVISCLPAIAPAPGEFDGRLASPEPQARLVYLFRHAEAAPTADPALDFERPITSDGVAACHRMHRYLSMADVLPDLVLCSAALRARQTLEAIRPAVGTNAEVNYLADIYTEGARALLERLKRSSANRRRVMLVGHNPALTSLVETLVRGSSEGEAEKTSVRFPPAALAILAFPSASWSELEEGSCELHSLVSPSDVAVVARGGS
jgi:phosphohistidine phosphatase